MKNRIKFSFQIYSIARCHLKDQGSQRQGTQQVEQIAQELVENQYRKAHFQKFMFSIERKGKLKIFFCCLRD